MGRGCVQFGWRWGRFGFFGAAGLGVGTFYKLSKGLSFVGWLNEKINGFGKKLVCVGLIGVGSSYFLPKSVRGDIVINEIVVDPQQDWNEDGIVTPSDEFFEIYNKGLAPFDLYGIELHLMN